MADIVNLGDKLKAQREETARFDLTAKMIPNYGGDGRKVRCNGRHCKPPLTKSTMGHARSPVQIGVATGIY